MNTIHPFLKCFGMSTERLLHDNKKCINELTYINKQVTVHMSQGPVVRRFGRPNARSSEGQVVRRSVRPKNGRPKVYATETTHW